MRYSDELPSSTLHLLATPYGADRLRHEKKSLLANFLFQTQGFPKNHGYLLGGHYDKANSILSFISGPPYTRRLPYNPYITLCTVASISFSMLFSM